MELWMDLLFGNWVGRLSVFTVITSFVIIVYLLTMLMRKSSHHE